MGQSARSGQELKRERERWPILPSDGDACKPFLEPDLLHPICSV
jgi:hypothetical protein